MLTLCRTEVKKVTNPDGANNCKEDINCLSDKVALLQNVRHGLVDPDTPKSAYSKTSNDGTSLKLVVS